MSVLVCTRCRRPAPRVDVEDLAKVARDDAERAERMAAQWTCANCLGLQAAADSPAAAMAWSPEPEDDLPS